MLKTTTTDQNPSKVTGPSIVSLSHAFRGSPINGSSGTRRRKNKPSQYLLNSNQVQLILEL